MKLSKNPMDPINRSLSFLGVLDWLIAHDFPDRVWLNTTQYNEVWIRVQQPPLPECPVWGDDIWFNRTRLCLKLSQKSPEGIDVSNLENWGCRQTPYGGNS